MVLRSREVPEDQRTEHEAKHDRGRSWVFGSPQFGLRRSGLLGSAVDDARRMPLQFLGSSGKASSRYSGLNPTSEERPSGVAIIRWRRCLRTRLGVVNLLSVARQSRPLLLNLSEGLTQLLLLLRGQVGRDDLEVVLPELVYHFVELRLAGEREER